MVVGRVFGSGCGVAMVVTVYEAVVFIVFFSVLVGG